MVFACHFVFYFDQKLFKNFKKPFFANNCTPGNLLIVLNIIKARDESAGKTAVEEFEKAGFSNVKFHQLDIDDLSSIKRFASFIKEKYTGLDLLVNNAAIAYKVRVFLLRK